MSDLSQQIRKGDGLIIVDLQWDFCPGGLLPVPDAHNTLPLLNKWIGRALAQNMPVYVSRDWHPKNHISFLERGGPWPPHCIQDTDGAQFHPDLLRDDKMVVVTKGTRFDKDQNSVFDETGFHQQLIHDGVRHLIIGGLALDGCVLQTVLDALHNGVQISVIQEGTRPMDAEAGRRAIERMAKEGAVII
ncbi:MAG: isochorismatase family protein [Desulfobacteraceae bacterium]|nr:isochorismatase family protein [Desulfobacteraceae bacterium]